MRDLTTITAQIKAWGLELGFQQIGIADVHLSEAETHLAEWLRKGYHGEMTYMAKHGLKRSRPALLTPGTVSVVVARMDYLPPNCADMEAVLENPTLGYVSRYALGRDYHKVLRKRLARLADYIVSAIGPCGYRVFVDSAPVLEKPLAQKAGLGWIGKHTNLLHHKAGSWFFLGEIYLDLPLPPDSAATAHCGTCQACIDICPTQAIVAPFQLDARRCISYLTIELKTAIPVEFRPLLGNRIYGCDDCQLVCPWNRFAQLSQETDFRARHALDRSDLISLFQWQEDEFLTNTEGSAIRRIGHVQWLRNIAVALGNMDYASAVMRVLESRLTHDSEMLREHIVWALAHLAKKNHDR